MAALVGPDPAFWAGKRVLLTEVPGDYVRINSGLGGGLPRNFIVIPVLFEGSVRAVLELASLSRFSITHQALLGRLPESIGLVLNTIEAHTLTNTLLAQSQSQSEELRARNLEVEEKAGQLAVSSRSSTASSRGRRSRPGP